MSELIGYLSEVEHLEGELTIPKEIGGGGSVNLQDKIRNYIPTETAQTEDVTADAGYDGLGQVKVNVGAISGSYVGSQVPRRSSSDLTQSGATINAPAGYYESAASKDIPAGTLGKPLAMKGAVSNHQVEVTPVVATQAGYIATQSKTGDPVIVSASELVSGTKSITANGSGIDVTNYASADVNVPNSYSAGDEGKVVSNGALVSQTAHADVTPTTSDQTIDTTLNNSLKVKGDADLVAGNIKKDVEIFGVTGSYEGGGSSDWTEVTVATAANKAGACMNSLFGTRQAGHIYFAYKPVMNNLTDGSTQLRSWTIFQTSTVGGGWRWNGTSNNSQSADASVSIHVGETFMICDREITLITE